MAEKKTEEVQPNVIVWEEPPATRGGRATSQAQAEIAAALQSKPGEWAKVASDVGNDGLASTIRKSTGANFRSGVYEARSVKKGEKLYDVFARFIEPRE